MDEIFSIFICAYNRFALLFVHVVNTFSSRVIRIFFAVHISERVESISKKQET